MNDDTPLPLADLAPLMGRTRGTLHNWVRMGWLVVQTIPGPNAKPRLYLATLRGCHAAQALADAAKKVRTPRK